jgi:hypothetical protein
MISWMQDDRPVFDPEYAEWFDKLKPVKLDKFEGKVSSKAARCLCGSRLEFRRGYAKHFFCAATGAALPRETVHARMFDGQ